MILDPHPWSLDCAWRRLCHEHDDVTRILEPDLIHSDNHLLIDRWQPPSPEFLKLNSDGSYREDAIVMGGGGVLRDSSGKWVNGFISQYLEAASCSFLAEALALRDGLRLAWDNSIRKLICNSDCKELIDAIADPSCASFHAHGWVLREIHALMTRNWRVELSWCCRDVNMVADCLAKRGSLLPVAGYSALATPSPELEVLLLKDIIGFS